MHRRSLLHSALALAGLGVAKVPAAPAARPISLRWKIERRFSNGDFHCVSGVGSESYGKHRMRVFDMEGYGTVNVWPPGRMKSPPDEWYCLPRWRNVESPIKVPS